MIGRRALLKWSAVCAATVAAPEAVSLTRLLTGHGGDGVYASEVAMGRACLQAVDGGLGRRLLGRVRDVLALERTKGPEAARRALRDLRQDDFACGRTVKVEGWIFAEAEVGWWLHRGNIRG